MPAGGLTRGKLDFRVAGYSYAGSGERVARGWGCGAGREGSYVGCSLGARSLAVNFSGWARVACLVA